MEVALEKCGHCVRSSHFRHGENDAQVLGIEYDSNSFKNMSVCKILSNFTWIPQIAVFFFFF